MAAADDESTRNRSESLPTREHERLQRLFENVGNFCFDKARESIEKHKEAQKIDFWHVFYKLTSTLIDLEKGYTNFSFLATKTIFGKKENLKNGYNVLRSDMRRAGEANLHSSNKQESLFAHLLVQISDFAAARLQLIEFYEQLVLLEMKLVASYEDLLGIVDDIATGHAKDFHHPILNGLQTAFTFECEVLQSLLRAQKLVSNLYFMEPLMCIHEAAERLTAWGSAAAESSQGLFTRHSGPPPLHAFLTTFKSFLLSKYTLYFHKVLSQQAMAQEMRNVVAKEPQDLVSKVLAFQRRSDAAQVLLFFNAGDQNAPYLGHGYFLPHLVGEHPSGINSYPVIFSCPPEPEPTDIDLKTIVMRISGRLDMGQPSEWEQLVYAYDCVKDRTYFIRKMEARVFLALLFSGQKPEKDKTVQHFLSDMAQTLRGFHALRQMRPT